MTATPRRRCPVCRHRVKPTRGGLIYGRRDSVHRDVCPASWHTYDITISGERHPQPELGLAA